MLTLHGVEDERFDELAASSLINSGWIRVDAGKGGVRWFNIVASHGNPTVGAWQIQCGRRPYRREGTAGVPARNNNGAERIGMHAKAGMQTRDERGINRLDTGRQRSARLPTSHNNIMAYIRRREVQICGYCVPILENGSSRERLGILLCNRLTPDIYGKPGST